MFFVYFFSYSCHPSLQICGFWWDVRIFPLPYQSSVCFWGDRRRRCVLLWHACTGVWLGLPPSKYKVPLSFLYWWCMHREHLATFTGQLVSNTEDWEICFNSVAQISQILYDCGLLCRGKQVSQQKCYNFLYSLFNFASWYMVLLSKKNATHLLLLRMVYTMLRCLNSH